MVSCVRIYALIYWIAIEMVLDKAIETAPSLLPHHLDYLTLIFLYKSVRFGDISALDDLPERVIKVYLTNSERQSGYINKLSYRNNKENNWQKNSHALALICNHIQKGLCNDSTAFMFDVSESDRYIRMIKESIL